MLSLETLGSLRLTGPDGDVLAGRRKELVLLTYLARRAPREVGRVELATLLWGERDEARARHSLRQALLQLKRVLGDALAVGTERVALHGGIVLDVVRFEEALAAERFADAVALWQGDFLAPADDGAAEGHRLWVEGERVALRTRLAGALDALVSRAEARGDWREALALSERWLEALPLDERAQLRLLQLLRLEGREREAQARYAEFALRLREELGRAPAAELERLGARLARDAAGLAPAVPAGAAALFTPELAGRSAPFAELAAAWQGARAGVAAVVVVEGEAGLGKTRLCQEFIDWVTRRSAGSAEPACVLWERGEPADREVAWSTARRLLAGLADAPGLAGATAEQLAELAELVPPVRGMYDRLPPATGADVAVTAAVLEALRAVAAEAPVLVCVDDFTLADAATQRLLLAAARRLAGAGVLLVLVEGTGGEAGGALDDLRAMRGVRRVRLQPLRRAGVETMLASMVPLDPGDRGALADRVSDESGGNPRRVVERVTALVDRGELRTDAGVWRLTPPAALAPPPATPGPPPPAAHPRPRRAVGALLGVLVLAALGGGALLAARRRSAGAPTIAGARSIAVIPLTNASADSATEYFTSGVTDELVHELSGVPGLRVAARTSVLALQGRRLDAREIGRALGVDAVIEGSVRTVGDSARITVQLVSTADGFDVWSERYDREMRDVLAVQDEIARAVVGKLRPRAAAAAAADGPAATPPGTRDAEAYTLYLRARHIADRPGPQNAAKAIAYYERAIARDSGFARAYAGLADSHVSLFDWLARPYSEAAPVARAMAERALRLDPSSAEAHMALARLLRYDWRWEDAEREMRLALAANPSDVQTHHTYSHLLVSLGRLDESLAESRRALELDPLNPRIAMHLCWHYYEAHRFDDALAACQRGLELDPNYPDSHAKLAWVFAAHGDPTRALAEIDRELAISGPDPDYRAARAIFLARAGHADSALAAVRAIERDTPGARLPRGSMAGVYAALGDRERAFALLEDAYAAHSSDLVILPSEPTLAPLRGDPRFDRLLARVGLSPRAP